MSARDDYPTLHDMATASFGYGDARDECGRVLAEVDRLRNAVIDRAIDDHLAEKAR